MSAVAWLAAAVLATVALGGCIGEADDPVDAPETAAGAPAAASMPAPWNATWQGHLAVGAALEVPAHVPEAAPLTEAVWQAMVNLRIDEVPQDLVLALDWTGAPGAMVQLMVNGPYRADGWKEWVTDFSSKTHHCVRIAAEELEPGFWYAMPHTQIGVGIEFTITATMVGGNAELLQAYDEWPSAIETFTAVVDHKTSATCA